FHARRHRRLQYRRRFCRPPSGHRRRIEQGGSLPAHIRHNLRSDERRFAPIRNIIMGFLSDMFGGASKKAAKANMAMLSGLKTEGMGYINQGQQQSQGYLNEA